MGGQSDTEVSLHVNAELIYAAKFESLKGVNEHWQYVTMPSKSCLFYSKAINNGIF